MLSVFRDSVVVDEEQRSGVEDAVFIELILNCGIKFRMRRLILDGIGG